MKLAIKQPLIIGDTGIKGEQGVCALYPFKNSDGEYLCRIVLGLRPEEYLKKYGRVNLCNETWSVKEARKRAIEIMFERRRLLILLGAKVCKAFGIRYEAFSVVYIAGIQVVILPQARVKNPTWKTGTHSMAQRLIAMCDARAERDSVK